MTEFTTLRNWQFFTSLDATEYEPLEVVMRGESDMITLWEFHVLHFFYMWKRMVRRVREGRRLDGKLGGWNHTVHCGMAMLNRERRLGESNTLATVIYPDC